jgi:two-component system chemotaxis response regulator CheY
MAGIPAGAGFKIVLRAPLWGLLAAPAAAGGSLIRPSLSPVADVVQVIRRTGMASILAVDDSASMRQMVSFTLKGAGYDVVEAADGVQALAAARERRFNLVITDVNMPNMDGITLIRELRGLPDYKFTPLLMLTTESSPEKKQQGKAAGATGWIVKPFNPVQLLGTVKKVLG